MTWNYRIVKYRKGGGYGLHEVYYEDDGTPMGMTADPCGFAVDAEEGEDGLLRSLMLALKDAFRRPVLDEQATWGASHD